MSVGMNCQLIGVQCTVGTVYTVICYCNITCSYLRIIYYILNIYACLFRDSFY